MTRTSRSLALLAACGAAAGLAGQASGQTVINISGSSLFESFFVAPASTNDYFDVDGDGIARIFNTNDQLAPDLFPPSGQSSGANQPWWNVQYRETGSVFGLNELINNGSAFAHDDSSNSATIPAITSSKSFLDRTQFVTNGVAGGAGSGRFNANNPGGSPVVSLQSNLQATLNVSTNPPQAGYRTDIAPVDVVLLWAVQNMAGSSAPSASPGAPGYGTNPRLSLNKQGTTTGAGFPNTLANLGPRNLNTSSPDSNTIFGTTIGYVPVAIATNLGTGYSQMNQSEARHLFATGRTVKGENLVAITRDSGSGTRNLAMNSLCLDPSWGVGENVGGVAGVGGSVAANEHIVGPHYVPSNKIASGDLETTVINTRLGIAYTGAERGASGPGWLTAGKLELLGIKADLIGGSTYVRPTIQTLLHNNPLMGGYPINGTETFATLGDPLAAPANKGGTSNGNPQVPNVEAAAYINNITQSIAAFTSLPGGSNTLFTPGEFLAVTFLPVAATDYVHDVAHPCQFVPNTLLNMNLQSWLASNNTTFNNGAYQSFGTVTLNGKVPTRETGVVYSDGVANGANYLSQGGAAVSYGTPLTDRNRIAGDFNGDGVRDINDALEMMKAYRSRNGGPSWTAPNGTGSIAGAPGSDAVIEILGDFNNDGNFDMADIRYWADGLAINPSTGNLDRHAAFTAIDNAWQTLTGNSNFFGTTIAGGRTYHAGDSCADVAGSGGEAPGWAPVGANGIIDAQDVAYITAQFTGNPYVTDGHATWSDVNEAVSFDLSCDVTGDLVVDQADVDFVNGLLGATTCYANCDNSTTPPILNVNDFICFQSQFAAGASYANCDHSTIPPVLNVNDFICFQAQFATGCP